MRQVRSGLALTVGLLVLTGCTDGGAQADPEPIIPSSSSAEPSPDEPTQTPTEEPPEMPAAASERSYAGAEAFVRHWVDAFNHAQNTGQTPQLAELADAGCVSCADATSSIDELYDGGETLQEGQWRIRQIGYDPVRSLSSPIFSSSIRQAAEVIRNADGAVVDRAPAVTFNVLFQLRRTSSGWTMRELEIEQL